MKRTIEVFSDSGHRDERKNAVPLGVSLARLAEALIRCESDDEVYLSLTMARFVCPVAAAWLDACVCEAKQRGVRVSVAHAPNDPTEYVSRVCPSLRAGDADQRHTLFAEHFPRRDLERFYGCLKKYKRQSDLKRSKPLLEPIAEIFENVFLHAESSVGAVVISQHYPNKRPAELHLAIVDRGMTIPVRIANRLGLSPGSIDQSEALKVAFTGNLSSEGAKRGSGMAIFRSFIESNNAEVDVYSGRAIARLSKTFEIRNMPETLPGTAYDIIIRGVTWKSPGEKEWF